MPEIGISSRKLTTICRAPDGAPQKTGPRNGEFAGGSENGAPETAKTGPRKCGAPDGARGGAKKKRSPAPPRSAVRGGDFLRGPGKSGAPRAPKRTLAAHAHTPRLSVLHVPDLMRHTLPSALTVLPLSPVRWVGRMMRCTSTGDLFPSLHIWGICFFLPGVGGFIPSPQPVFLLLTPLVRRTDQALRLEAHGTWWRGSRRWIFFYFWLKHYVLGPSFPCFRSTPSNSRVLSAVVGTLPAGCFTSSTLLLHYLQEWA